MKVLVVTTPSPLHRDPVPVSVGRDPLFFWLGTTKVVTTNPRPSAIVEQPGLPTRGEGTILSEIGRRTSTKDRCPACRGGWSGSRSSS